MFLVPLVYSPFEVCFLQRAVVCIHDLVSALEECGQLRKHGVLLAVLFESTVVWSPNSGNLCLEVSASSRDGARVWCAVDRLLGEANNVQAPVIPHFKVVATNEGFGAVNIR